MVKFFVVIISAFLLGGGVYRLLSKPKNNNGDAAANDHFVVTDMRGNTVVCAPHTMSDKIFGELLWAKYDKDAGALKIYSDMDLFAWCAPTIMKGRN